MKATDKEWFESWFDSPYYHILYKNRDENEAKHFISKLINYLNIASGSAVLDLGCGKGRHSKYISELGMKCTGIDLSTSSITFAKKFENEKLHFEVGDMRYFEIPEQFDAIFNLFTSFGYFENEEDNWKVLNQINQHLKVGGKLVIDYLNPHHSSIFNCQTFEILIDHIQFETKKFVRDNRIYKQIKIRDGEKLLEFEEMVQLLDIEWFEKALYNSGFEVDICFGNYELLPYNSSTSQRMIIIATKK